MTGTSVMPSLRAASRRAWPAITIPSAPARIGLVHPNSAIDGRDLGDLFRTMRARIPGVRNQLLDRPRHHLQVRHAVLG